MPKGLGNGQQNDYTKRAIKKELKDWVKSYVDEVIDEYGLGDAGSGTGGSSSSDSGTTPIDDDPVGDGGNSLIGLKFYSESTKSYIDPRDNNQNLIPFGTASKPDKQGNITVSVRARIEDDRETVDFWRVELNGSLVLEKENKNSKNIIFTNLAPGKEYRAIVRSFDKNKKGIGKSNIITFLTAGKTTSLPDVTNLQATFDSGSFTATWDGTQARTATDFSGFTVIITSSEYPTKSKSFFTRNDSFTLSFDDNLFLFGGIARTITITVKTVDNSGNLSAGISATAGNAPPSAPTNVVVTAQNSGYQVSWDDPKTVDPDYTSTNIYESSTSGGTYYIIYTSSTSPVFIPAISFSKRYVKVSHVDAVGGESTLVGPFEVTPIQPVQVDETPPDQRTSITFTPAVGGVTATWVNPTDTTNNSDIAGVTIRYAKTSSPTNYTWVDVPFTFASPISSKTIDGLLPATSYDFSLSAYDKIQNRTAYSTTSSITTLSDTTPPPKPTAPVVAAGNSAGGPMIVRVTQTATQHGTSPAVPMPIDTSYFKVFMLNSGVSSSPGAGISTNTNAIEIGNITAGFNGSQTQNNFFVPLEEGEQRYFYTRAVDTSGNISDASDATQSQAMAVFTNAYIKDLSADKITAGRINANEYIQVGTTSEQITIKSTSALGQIYSGVGTYANANTGLYIDSSGKFSLKDRLFFDGTNLTLSGTVNATGGIFNGNIQVANPGAIFAGASASSGARVIMSHLGLASFNSAGQLTFALDAGTGNVFLDGYITIANAQDYATKTGLAQTNYTTINGGNITTGKIRNSTFNPQVDGSGQQVIDGTKFSITGTMLNLDSASFISPKLRISESGELEAVGKLTSNGLIVKGSNSASTDDKFPYLSWSSFLNGTSPQNVTYALVADTGADIIIGASSGTEVNPAKIRWIYNGMQRASVGWEVPNPGGDESNFAQSLVIRGAPSSTGATGGKVVVHGQSGTSGQGEVVLRADILSTTGVNNNLITISGNNRIVAVDGQGRLGYAAGTTVNLQAGYLNATDNPSNSNRITYSNSVGAGTYYTQNGLTARDGDIHLRFI